MTAPRLAGAAALAAAKAAHAAETGFKARRVRETRELDEQARAFELARLRLAPTVEAWSIPNEGALSPKMAKKMKAAGLRAGVFDTFWAWPGARGVEMRMIEFKAPDKKPAIERLRPAQAEFSERLDALGVAWLATDDAEAAVAWLIAEGAPVRCGS